MAGEGVEYLKSVSMLGHSADMGLCGSQIRGEGNVVARDEQCVIGYPCYLFPWLTFLQ